LEKAIGLRGWLCNAELEERDLAGIRAYKCTQTQPHSDQSQRLCQLHLLFFFTLIFKKHKVEKKLCCWC